MVCWAPIGNGVFESNVVASMERSCPAAVATGGSLWGSWLSGLSGSGPIGWRSERYCLDYPQLMSMSLGQVYQQKSICLALEHRISRST
jgi:hypothetical protein